MTIDWELYQKCTVCMAETGKPCLSLLGLIRAAGRIEESVAEPHSTRKLRAAAARAGGDR